MKLLYVSFPFPAPPNTGIRQRHYHLIREFARNHRVTVASILPREEEGDAGAEPLESFVERVIVAGPEVLPTEIAPAKNRWLNRVKNISRLLGTPAPGIVQHWRRPEV